MSLYEEDDRGGFVSTSVGPCAHCGDTTKRIDICFEGFLHYTCAPAYEAKYWEAVYRQS